LPNNLSKKILDSIYINAPVGIIIVDANLVISSVNETALQFELIEASSTDELIGLKIDSFPLFNTERFKNDLEELKERIPFEAELSTKLTLDGNEITVIVKAAPNFEENVFTGAIFVIEDFKIPLTITDEKVIENELFNNFVKSISDYFVITNGMGEIIYSPPPGSLKSYNEIFNKRYHSIKQIFGGEYIDEITELFNEVIAKEEPVYSQCINDNIDTSIGFQLNFIPIIDKLKKLNYVFVLFQDITKTYEKIKNLENEAKELRTYQSIASTILEAIITFDEKGIISFWNNAATRVFGLSKIETFGKFIGNIIEDFSENNFDKIIKDLKENKRFETKIQFKLHGITRIISIKMALSEDDDTKSVVALCSNITDRENLEKALRNSEETFRNIVTNTHEYLCTYTLDGKITYCNPSFIKEFGYTEIELQEKEIASLIDIDAIENSDFDLNTPVSNNGEEIELILVKKNGKKIFVDANFTFVSDLQGNARYYIAVFSNITEKKKREHELKLIRTVFETANEGIILTQNGKITLANIACADLFGYDSIEEILSLNSLEFIDEKDRARAEEDLVNYSKDDKQHKVIYEGIKRNGDLITIEKGIKRFSANKNEYIIESYIDVTKEQKAQNTLEKYRTITENIDDAIWTMEYKDDNPSKFFISPSIYEITKYIDDEFIRDIRLWTKIIHPDDKKNIISKLKRVLKDRVRQQVELEYRILGKQGSLIWVRNKLNFVRNEFGEIEKIFGLLSDITLTKKNEEKARKITDELKALSESKDRFISIVSHDLRTPFSSILGFTDILLADDGITEEKKKQYIGFIQESAHNMLKLVNSILDWTRLQTGRIEYVAERLDVLTIANNSIQMLSGNAIKKDIKLYSTIEHEAFVHGDRNLLLQGLNNLISNAIKFTQTGGEIVVSAESLIDKKVIQFRVRDSGVGISEEDIAKLFSVDAKYTTEGTAGEKGSGLGLSLVKEIVNKHGGEIHVESEMGIGTSFVFTIPISSTNILLIDSSPTDTILYKKLLNNIMPNYQVSTANNGVNGFEIIKESLPAIIITDHNMPELSGFQLVRNILDSDLKYKPPIIVLSSDITPDIKSEYEELGVEYVFKKPVDLTVFKNAIEKLLQKALVT
jgi:PAS domain S-box-containing protein